MPNMNGRGPRRRSRKGMFSGNPMRRRGRYRRLGMLATLAGFLFRDLTNPNGIIHNFRRRISDKGKRDSDSEKIPAQETEYEVIE